jgi:hypothetical protein
MERIERMKTATSRACQVGLLAGIAALSISASLLLPANSRAQEDALRPVPTGSRQGNIVTLAPDAPDRYTVKPGDTLWDISKVFLRDPWYWPEIWYVNPQIQNPHLIYPGDVLTLTFVEGRPRVTLAERGNAAGVTRLSPRVRSQPVDQAITTIPYEVIAKFAGRPSLLEKNQVKSAPYILAMRDRHVIGGAGNDVYARDLRGAEVDSRYSIVHVDEPLKDPESHDVLGYRGIYVGAARVAAATDPIKLAITASDREALQGDKLFPETIDVSMDFVPHPAPDSLHGVIMAVSGVTVVGQYQVIAVNRGTRQGLELGSVLGIFQAGDTVKDYYAGGGLASGNTTGWNMTKGIRLPEERTGVAIVFKTYDRMSYALIMEAVSPVRLGDRVHAP